MELDGQRQRNALTAAERAVEALGRGAAERATVNAAKAADLDQLGLFAGLPAAVARAVAEVEEGGEIAGASWDAVSAALPEGPLRALVESTRS